MPKVPQNSGHPSPSDPLTSGSHPNILKRNQACHQCRRRKLKCDAKRPCSTCIRSHAHALSHAPAGTEIPPHPECTFDDVAESNGVVNEGPKSRYEKLENRISELEALLRQKETATETRNPPSHQSDSLSRVFDSHAQSQLVISSPSRTHPDVIRDANSSSSLSCRSPQASSTQTAQGFSGTSSPSSGTSTVSQYQNGLETLGGVRDLSNPLPRDAFLSPSPVGSIVFANWPPRLPGLELLRHLVELFFVFHPHSNRLLHAASFMTSLSLPPTYPKFPATPVLHAICAIGSLYTAAVTSPPLPNFAEVEPDEIFSQRHRIKEERPDSFAEEHAKLAKETADRLESLGEDLFQVLQARIILSWFYWSHSKWVEVFVTSAHSLRISVPLGLNMLPPLHSISNSVRPASILPPARTVTEDEIRRNTFWLAYATERQHGCGNGWALSLDDKDITQLLPVRGDQFEDGILVTPLERQWAHSRDLLLVHPEKQIDSFILYIKGTIMMSHVKTFNLRFRARHFAGDASVASLYNDSSNPTEHIDPRGSQAFIELDHTVSSFRLSFPPHLRNPIIDNVVDSHLYTACLMPHCATIVLHDPHADVRQSGCISALKILTAARAILDLIYNVWSTSYDISLLDSFCVFCWFVAGRVLVRFLQAAQDADSQDQISTLRGELDFVQLAIAKVGERIPLAFRFARMLTDLIIKRCGPSSGLTSAQITFPRQMTQQGNHVLQTLYEESFISGREISLHENLHDPTSFMSLA